MSAPAPENGTLRYRVEQLEQRQAKFEERVEKLIDQVNSKVDRLIMTVVGGTIMVVVALIVNALTNLANGP